MTNSVFQISLKYSIIADSIPAASISNGRYGNKGLTFESLIINIKGPRAPNNTPHGQNQQVYVYAALKGLL